MRERKFAARSSSSRVARACATRLLHLFLFSSAATLILGCTGKPNPSSSGGADEAGTGGDAAVSPPGPYPKPGYQRLSETGLFSDPPTQLLAEGLQSYEPNFVLWADSADKKRWVALPASAVIDTSDMDHWLLPVGTRFFKQFSLGSRPLETRLIERHGEGPNDYWMGAFLWNEDASEAELVAEGQKDVLGSSHDVPSQKQCWSCHNGEAGRVLGFSAMQLAHGEASLQSGLDLSALVDTARLSVTPEPGLRLRPPGDATTSEALGYLHANCGHCHNLHGTAWPDTQMVLRLRVAETAVETSELYQSLVGQSVQYFRDPAVSYRVVAGSPESSAILLRMLERGTKQQMPPLGSELADASGIALVSAWITALPTQSAP